MVKPPRRGERSEAGGLDGRDNYVDSRRPSPLLVSLHCNFSAKMMHPLRITVDDFGATEGVNDAVIELHRSGVVNYAALMVMGDAAQDAVKRAKDSPSLHIGLHFVLSDERSLGRGASLIDSNGVFHRRSALLKKALLAKLNRHEIKDELIAQFNYLCSKGIQPTFINGHQHVHIFPVIRDVVVDFAAEHNLYVRLPMEPICFRFRLDHMIKKMVARNLAMRFKKLLDHFEVPHNSGFISNFADSKRDFSLNGCQQALQNGHSVIGGEGIWEYMVHPAKNTTRLSGYWMNDQHLAEERVVEYNSMRAKEFKKLCNHAGFEIV